MAKKNLRSNRNVDELIVFGDWAIDFQWGLQRLGKYLSEVSLRSQGATLDELGYSERRMESRKINFLTQEGQSFTSFNLRDQESIDKIPEGTIARLKYSGVMRLDDGMSSRGVSSLCDDLRLLQSINNVDAVILEMNTGGGESLSGNALKNELKDITKTMPVVVYAQFLGSAGVNGTLTASEIIAAGNGAMIGSIGSYYSIGKDFVKWYRKNVDDIYSNTSPQKNKEFRSYLEGDKVPYQSAATQSADLFRSEVRKYRTLGSQAKDTLEGGMFYAKDAKSRGLVDSVNTLDYAIKRAKALSK